MSAAEDVDGDAGTAVIDHTVSSGDANYNGIVTGLTATEIDNDPRGLTLSKTSLTVIEGSTETYTVKLKTKPSDDVTVSAVKSGDTDAITLDSTDLTFFVE